MPPIQPQGQFYLIRGVPLTSEYNHTIWFDTTSEQERFFLKNVFYQTDRMSYIANNTVKINVPIDQIREANYCMFRNSGFSDKWFYAFVDSLSRISNEVTAVSYTIDVMQTWFLFNTVLRPCLVDREHVDDDTPFKHHIPEGLETGDYAVFNMGYLESKEQYPYAYIFAVTQYYNESTNQWTNVTGRIYSGMFSGVKYLAPKTEAQAETLLKRYLSAGRADAILSITSCPRWIIPYVDGSDYEVAMSQGPIQRVIQDTEQVQKVKQIDRYTPYNNKLFCYPYNYAKIINHEGQELDLHYEYFNSPTMQFVIFGAMNCAPQLILFAKNYLQPENTQTMNNCQSIASGIFSPVPFTTDNYRSWLAQTAATRANQISMANTNLQVSTSNQFYNNQVIDKQLKIGQANNNVAIYNAFANGATSAASLNASGILGSFSDMYKASYANELAYQIMRLDAQREKNALEGNVRDASMSVRAIYAAVEDHSVIPPSGRGNMISDTVQTIGFKGFQLLNIQVKAEYARRIDMFFQMFGYKCNEVKIPNTHVRKLWTYTKTVNCNVKPKSGSGCSGTELAAINTIFNNGITFWRGELGILNFMEYDQKNEVSN